MKEKTFQNPILPGFYPDPSVCRVGDEYYLVTSTFAYFPGVPIFRSKDLVYWEQIGNVLDRRTQLPLEGAEVSRGIFAPTIRFHNGMFYVITTNVSSGGNFLVTAVNPAGKWSDPHYIRGAAGIDPSLFFDKDGKCYYQGTCERREGGKFFGDNEIYLQELDLKTMSLVGERYVIWHCALRDAVWPESPHIYRRGEYYYLLISEGGTAHEHAVTIARSKTLTGYYTGNKSNPILTHRHLGRDYPIVNVGHGDLVETPAGEWWMVLLASRPYGGRYRNLGRETFLVPVEWEEDWPVVNYGIGLVQDTERFPIKKGVPQFVTKSISKREQIMKNAMESVSVTFRTQSDIPLNMLYLRNPVTADYMIKHNPPEAGLHMRLSKNTIAELDTVSYLCVRQQHMSFEAGTWMQFDPASENECAGLVIFQSHKYHYQFTLTLDGDALVMVLTKYENGNATELVRTEVNIDPEIVNYFGEHYLKVVARGQKLFFYHTTKGENYTPIYVNADARILSTDVAGGFVGTTIGMYASSNGDEAGRRYAVFKKFYYNELRVEI